MKKRLYRIDGDRKIAGVCGGIAEYFDWDPSLVRLVFALICFLGGFGIILYVLLWVIVPSQSKVL
ncbi:MAG: PspC domain-containing protein [Candidatus Omnitrophica bacterium]|nr:PspC domain-containing protein [Candidatus Omnitrophota bacterium]